MSCSCATCQWKNCSKALCGGAVEKSAALKTHNHILKNEVGLAVPDDHLKTLELLNDISVVTRYPEDIQALVKAFKKGRVEDYLSRTKGLLRWLKRDTRLKK
jgi:hypothetical protein